MEQARFDGLRILCREQEGRNGRVELCRGPDGVRCVRLCLTASACQREFLSALEPDTPIRMERGALEVLLPWQQGVSLRQWLYERSPTPGQRRDACLSLLEQQITEKTLPCLTVLSARTENLVFTGSETRLQYLPDLRRWEYGQTQAKAVCAIAGLMCEIMTGGMGRLRRRRIPEELTLLCRRARENDYTDWGQLQRDVAAIPDQFPRFGKMGRMLIQRIRDWLLRHGKTVARVIATLLITAALLSMIAAFRGWKTQRRNMWTGMTPVGNQELEEGAHEE